MDALEFLTERSRMCSCYMGCNKCPLERGNCGLSTSVSNEEYERIITTVEQWSKKHPRKTRQDAFLEQYPEALCTENGIISICPATLYCSQRYNDGNCKNSRKGCENCRREFWLEEVK